MVQKKQFKTINLNLKALLVLMAFFMLSSQLSAQYVKTSGTKILDPSGKDLHLHGVNLGNWLIWEGYLMMGDYNFRTHTQFFNNVKDACGGNLEQAVEFEHQWRMNYVTDKEISELSGLGYNFVRVPFHFNLFWDYSSWSVSDRGFQYIDRVISFCRNHNMYVLLDMHAAPGYQNPGDHCDNVNSNSSQPRGSVTFWDGDNVNIAAQVWRHIAARYANEPVVWGYDLINEPVPQDGREYELLPSLVTMRNAIREVDNNHIIVAEGSWWSSDFSKIDWTNGTTQSKTGINYKWDNNLVYQTHHYSDDLNPMKDRLAITNKLNIPLYLGEYGENTDANIRTFTDWCINNNVHYSPWSFKKMYHARCLWSIQPSAPYNDVRNYISNGGTRPSNAYNDMIWFCKNNITNGSGGINWYQGFYDATKYTGSVNNIWTISMQGSNGLFVSSENGASAMICNRPSAGGWEKFTVVDAGNGKIALQGTNGKFVSSGNGTSALICNRTTIGDWEAFTWVELGNNKFALQGSNGKYVCSENGGSGMMCNRNAIGSWETFTWATTTKGATIALNIEDEILSSKVYPNPVKNVLHIPQATDNDLSIIYDMKGNKVIEVTGTSTNISNLNKGLYIINTKGNVQKFIRE
jgi:endoglucanase